MTNKIIRVSGCWDCPCYDRFYGKTQHLPYGGLASENFHVCSKDNCKGKQMEERVNIKYWVDNKTLPDNCPLDDELADFQKEVLITAKLGMEIRRDATKHIRATVKEYGKAVESGVDASMTLLNSMKADIKQADEEVKE